MPSRRQPSQPASPEPDPSQPSQISPSSTSTSPSAAEVGSGLGSSAADFLADPGPAFDPRNSPPAPEVEPVDQGVFEEWDEGRVRELLVLQGDAMHALLAVGPDDEVSWVHTEKDLKSIAPPLTRILNRYDSLRAAAAAGDEILLASAVARYGTRNYIRRRRLLAAIAVQEPQPITGVPADPIPEPPAAEVDWLTQAPPALVPKGRR
jgi:hypothetical protein